MEDRFDSFTYLVSSLSRCIRKIKTEEVLEYDLKSPHVACLYYIKRAEKLTAKELCDLSGEDKGAISRSIDYLENKGLVVHDVVEGKRYKTPYILTEKGKCVASQLCKKINEALAKAGEGLNDEDRAIMYRSLEIIHNNLKEICQKY